VNFRTVYHLESDTSRLTHFRPSLFQMQPTKHFQIIMFFPTNARLTEQRYNHFNRNSVSARAKIQFQLERNFQNNMCEHGRKRDGGIPGAPPPGGHKRESKVNALWSILRQCVMVHPALWSIRSMDVHQRAAIVMNTTESGERAQLSFLTASPASAAVVHGISIRWQRTTYVYGA
jgi:hypothetical protein